MAKLRIPQGNTIPEWAHGLPVAVALDLIARIEAGDQAADTINRLRADMALLQSNLDALTATNKQLKADNTAMKAQLKAKEEYDRRSRMQIRWEKFVGDVTYTLRFASVGVIGVLCIALVIYQFVPGMKDTVWGWLK